MWLTAARQSASVLVCFAPSARCCWRPIDELEWLPNQRRAFTVVSHGALGGLAVMPTFDSYRTTLTGLTRHEMRALFMLSIPAPLAELGVGQDLRAALLKLSAALPVAHRQDEERVRERIHLDAVEWFHTREPVPHLKTIQQAVWQDRRLLLTYHLPFGARVERLADPYGLVAKASVWYLVCARDGHIRVQRVSYVLEARLADGCFERPADFDLAAFWNMWCTEVEANRSSYPVSVRVSENLVPFLPRFFGHRMRTLMQETGPPDAAGWVTMTLPFETLEDARSRILGFGGGDGGTGAAPPARERPRFLGTDHCPIQRLTPAGRLSAVHPFRQSLRAKPDESCYPLSHLAEQLTAGASAKSKRLCYNEARGSAAGTDLRV